MKTRSRMLFAAGALTAPLLFTAATSAGDPEGQLDGGQLDAGQLDGGQLDADADAAPLPLPSYRAAPFAAERSAEPRPREWASAPRVVLDHTRPLAFIQTEPPAHAYVPCEVRRLREWLRIHCVVSTGAIVLLGGNVDGLVMRLDPAPKQDFVTTPEGGEVIFPVRRGDRRVIEWLEVAFGYKGMQSVVPNLVLSEQWPPGDEAPSIVAE